MPRRSTIAPDGSLFQWCFRKTPNVKRVPLSPVLSRLGHARDSPPPPPPPDRAPARGDERWTSRLSTPPKTFEGPPRLFLSTPRPVGVSRVVGDGSGGPRGSGGTLGRFSLCPRDLDPSHNVVRLAFRM